MYRRLVVRFDPIGLVQPVFAQPDQHPGLALHRRFILRPPYRDIALGDPLLVCVAVFLLAHPSRQRRAPDLQHSRDLVPGASESRQLPHLLGIDLDLLSRHSDLPALNHY